MGVSWEQEGSSRGAKQYELSRKIDAEEMHFRTKIPK